MKLSISNEAKDLIAQRKQVMRDLWNGKPVDAIPVDIRYEADRIGTVRAVTMDGDKQLEMAMRNVQTTLDRLHLTDAIPAMRPDVGCSCIASAFGAEYYWGANEDSTPGIKDCLIPDIEDGIDMLLTAGLEKASSELHVLLRQDRELFRFHCWILPVE